MTLVDAMTLFMAITWAGSAQPAASNLLDVQQQVVLDALSQKDFATADKAFNQMIKCNVTSVLKRHTLRMVIR